MKIQFYLLLGLHLMFFCYREGFSMYVCVSILVKYVTKIKENTHIEAQLCIRRLDTTPPPLGLWIHVLCQGVDS